MAGALLAAASYLQVFEAFRDHGMEHIQVLLGRTRAEAAAKLERHGTRPGLVHGTVDDLRRHFGALEAAGASWAICSC